MMISVSMQSIMHVLHLHAKLDVHGQWATCTRMMERHGIAQVVKTCKGQRILQLNLLL